MSLKFRPSRFFGLVIVPTMIMSLSALIYLCTSDRFNVRPSILYQSYYFFDVVLTPLLLYLFLSLFKSECSKLVIFTHDTYVYRLNDYTILYILITSYAVYEAYSFFNLLGTDTIAALISTNRSSGYLCLLTKPIIEIVFVIMLLSKGGRLNLGVAFLGFIAYVVIGFSRTDILFVLWLILIYFALFSEISFQKVINRGTIIVLVLVSFSALITIMQERSTDFYNSISSSFDSLLRYRIYSIYLAEHLSQYVYIDIDKYLFPFLGFFSERFVLLFDDFNQLVSSQGSTFVSDFVFLKNGDQANALYPWWSWFVITYGPFGLLLKSVYSSFILFIVMKLRLPVTFLYFIYLFFIHQFQRHPIINATDFYNMIGVVAFDVFVICTTKEFRSKYIIY